MAATMLGMLDRRWLWVGCLVLGALAEAACGSSGAGRRREAVDGRRAPRLGLVEGARPVERAGPRRLEPEVPTLAGEPAPAPPSVSPKVSPNVPVKREPARGERLLVGTHPEVVRLALEIHARARTEGIEVVFISGYRKYVPRKKTARGGLASWHNFGLAFDLNLSQRKTMKEAERHFKDDEATWRRLGAMAAELGVIWGGDFRNPDIFHFEWHPGHDAWINAEDLRQLLELAGPDGARYERTWRMLQGL